MRYEGEATLAALVDCLRDGGDWKQIPGIAYASNGDVVVTEARALAHDLDSLPFPYRPYEPEHVGGFPTLPLLASRGCARRCSFCSIHTFYRTAPGKVVRVRQPAKVVEEMLALERRFRIRVFLFQDDDFPLWGPAGRRWAAELTARLTGQRTGAPYGWKISCRGEYVEPELFLSLREAGLFLVYMGIESGVDQGLRILHKEMTAQGNLQAVQTLKDVGLLFSYGFMLFDPSSTFESVRENIGFLRQIVGDGSAAATFCRMLPYGGTPIRDLLQREGRLRGDLTHPDYVFLDTRLNEYHLLLSKAARPWLDQGGLSHQISYAWDELEAIRRLVPATSGSEVYVSALRRLAADSNERLFRLVEETSVAFEHGDRGGFDPLESQLYCDKAGAQLMRLRNHFVSENILLLADSVNADCSSGPVLAPQVH